MVVGNGLIASAFIKDYQDDDKFLIFASGVSDSLEDDEFSFLTEESFLRKSLYENKDKHIVYFTSFIDNNPQKIKYSEHKKCMEQIVQLSGNWYTILKLPQAIGRGGNKNSLINFLVDKIKNRETIDVYKNTYKSIIDVEDIKGIIDILVKKWIDKNTYVAFPYIEKILIKDIVHLISNQLKIEPIINLMNTELYDLPEPSLAVKSILNHLNIESNKYTERVIKKYVQ